MMRCIPEESYISYERAQTGGRFMISKLGIAFVLEYLNRKIIALNQ